MKSLTFLKDLISISDIDKYFDYIFKKHETLTDKIPVQLYVKKFRIELFRLADLLSLFIIFKNKSGYYLKLFTPEAMKLLGITEKENNKRQNGENVQQIEIIGVVLVHYNIVNNQY